MNRPFKEWRRRRRGRRQKRRLAWERERFLNAFQEQGLSVPDEAAIARRLTKRFPNPAGKSKGDLTVLAVFHHDNWERDTLLPALERFGNVRHYDWGNTFDQNAPDWFAGGREAMNRDLCRWVSAMAADHAIDLIFCYLSGHQVVPETLRRLREIGAPLVNVYFNDKENFVGKSVAGQAVGLRDICRYFDLCWTSTRDALEKYCVCGATPIYLPEGANPELHSPRDVPMDLDVTFVGQRYGHRPWMIDRLRQAGIAVTPFGQGWPNGPLSVEDMVAVYSRSRINLGFGGVRDMDDVHCLKGRDFEVPLSGGLYLTQDNDELRQWYAVGEEILTYRTLDEAIDRIRDMLAHPERAAEIRRAGRQRALASHTWDHRFDRIFQLFGVR